MSTASPVIDAVEVTANGVSFTLSIGGRVLPVTVSLGALAALEHDEGALPIPAFWNNVLLILRTAARMIEQNPMLQVIYLNRGHFY